MGRPATIHIGTSGFSYGDWVGPVYPAGTKKTDFLALYAERFHALEVNYTYYRMPTAETMRRLVDKSHGGVRMAVKLTDLFTHKREYGPADVVAFGEAMEPLADSGILGCLLAQFPYSFKPSVEARAWLEALFDQFTAFPLVVEMRHHRWADDRFFDFLRQRRVGFCCVDEPRLPGLLPPLDVVTSPVAYVRFHGRNEAKWWEHDRPEERYDYLYPSEELREWLPRLRRMAEHSQELFVFFNNHFEGKAVQNAEQLLALLSQA